MSPLATLSPFCWHCPPAVLSLLRYLSRSDVSVPHCNALTPLHLRPDGNDVS